jgi:hypothetical protein
MKKEHVYLLVGVAIGYLVVPAVIGLVTKKKASATTTTS